MLLIRIRRIHVFVPPDPMSSSVGKAKKKKKKFYSSVADPEFRIRSIRMFLGLLDPDPDPDPLVRDWDPDTFIIKQKYR